MPESGPIRKQVRSVSAYLVLDQLKATTLNPASRARNTSLETAMGLQASEF
jgi:hypothetical protein